MNGVGSGSADRNVLLGPLPQVLEVPIELIICNILQISAVVRVPECSSEILDLRRGLYSFTVYVDEALQAQLFPVTMVDIIVDNQG